MQIRFESNQAFHLGAVASAADLFRGALKVDFEVRTSTSELP